MSKRAAIVGAGPAGLIAAEVLTAHGWSATVFDHMPSIGRKFLMAGRGGLNLTHSEPFDAFVQRYGAAADWARPMLERFSPTDLIAWANGLGQATFVGSSGRVFPKSMKASPLLRAWLKRLDAQGVEFKLRHRWTGWGEGGALRFDTPDGCVAASADATILALGGGSWPKLGSDGSWADILRAHGVAVAPLSAANCGIMISWSDVFRARFAGTPLHNIGLSIGPQRSRGEGMIAAYGLEGGVVYSLSNSIRAALEREGYAAISIDLRPDMTEEALVARLAAARSRDSLSNVLRKQLALTPAAINLLREAGMAERPEDPRVLARAVKRVELRIDGLAPLSRAISSVGGVSREAVDADLRVRALAATYVVGEMIDWDAPTGGYLLQLCFSSAVHAARRICGI